MRKKIIETDKYRKRARREPHCPADVRARRLTSTSRYFVCVVVSLANQLRERR